MFVAWNALLTNLTFGKGESQTANHSLSFDSLMSTTLFIYLLYFLLLIQKHFTTISIDYCKSKTKKNNFWKITGCLTKMFYRLLFRKLDIGCKTNKNFGKHKLLVDSNKRDGKFWARQRNREWYFFRFFTSVGQRKKFFLCPTLVTRFLYWAQNLSSLLLLSTNIIYAIDIADPSSMQDACDMNFVTNSLTVESLWLSGRASERGIRRSEVRFFMRTQNFLSVPRSWQDEKTSFSTNYFI